MYLRLLTIENRRVGNKDELGALRAKWLTFLPFIKPFVFASVTGIAACNDANVGPRDVL